MRLFSLILVSSPVCFAEFVELNIPYYQCIHQSTVEPVPGVCNAFHSQYHKLAINVDQEFTSNDANNFCASDESRTFSETMAFSVPTWGHQSCVEYISHFVRSEMLARQHQRLNYDIAVPDKIKSVLERLDEITSTYGFVEGHLGFPKYERKRSCFLNALVTSLPENAQIAEIGFNAGHSAAMTLTALPTAKLTSFDICGWPYNQPTHQLIQDEFGVERATLVCGDSAISLPAYQGERFDYIFIDGGHLYLQAYKDIKNAQRIVRPGALVIVDDCQLSPLTNETGMITDVTAAFRHAVVAGIIVPLPNVCGEELCIGRYA